MPIPAAAVTRGTYRLLTGGLIEVEQVLGADVVVKDERGKRARLRASNVGRIIAARVEG